MPVISAALERLLVGLALVGYLTLAVAFSAGPIFEGPDEIEHYRYIRYVAENRALPDARSRQTSQFHHAPLYYILIAPLAAVLPVEDGSFAQIDGRLNPFYPYLMEFPGADNKNLYLHERSEAFPGAPGSIARVVHILRLFTVLLGALTVLTAYRVFRLLFPGSPAARLLALFTLAFWPQFAYQSSALNNDNLLFLLSTVTLWLLLRQRRDGATWRSMALIGAAVGATLLTKVNAAFILLPVGAAVAMDRRAWRYVPLAALIAALIIGPWLARNYALYGDLTGVGAMLAGWPREVIAEGQFALGVGLERLGFVYAMFWARFGHGAVPVGEAIYRFYDLLLTTGLLGCALSGWWQRRRLDGRTLAVLAAFGLTWLAVPVYVASLAWSGNQGRYVLPGIALWSAIIGGGAAFWLGRLPARVRTGGVLAYGVALAGVAAVCCFGYYGPAYALEQPSAMAAAPLDYQFADYAVLTGMEPADPRGAPGAVLRVTLHWRALRPGPATLQSYLHSVESAIVRRDSLPGTGTLLATDWREGETWAETYLVPIPADAAPGAYTLIAGLYDAARGEKVPLARGGAWPVGGRLVVE